MKILKGPDPWKREVACKAKQCGTVVEIEAGDVCFGYFGGSYCEEGEPSYYVECPSCGGNLFLKDLPTHVMQLARAKKEKK